MKLEYDDEFWPVRKHEFIGVSLSALLVSVVFGFVGIAVHIAYQPMFQWNSSWLTMTVEWLFGVLAVYLIIALLLLPVQFLSHFWKWLPPIIPHSIEVEVSDNTEESE